MAVQGVPIIEAENSTTTTRVRISDRVTKLRETFIATKPYVCGERSHLFTEYWKQSGSKPIVQVQMGIISRTEHRW
jgi:hypothetical protein